MYAASDEWHLVVHHCRGTGTQCITHRAANGVLGRTTTTPTFTKDIAPILQAKCESCHRVDSIAPMPFVTYEETRPYVRAIKDRVAARQMPPWHIDKTIGIQKFKNDRSLTDEQIDTIVRWVDGGAPKGDPKDMPAPVKWPNEQGWNFASMFGQTEPDLDHPLHAVPSESRRPGRMVETQSFRQVSQKHVGFVPLKSVQGQ